MLLSRRIADIVPGAIVVDAAPVREATPGSVLADIPADEPDLPDSFRTYLTGAGLDEPAARSTATAFARLLSEVDDEAPPPVPAEELLRTALEDIWTGTEAS